MVMAIFEQREKLLFVNSIQRKKPQETSRITFKEAQISIRQPVNA